MKKNLITAILMTVVTTVLLGLVYPLVVTGIAQVFFHDKANGQLIARKRRSDWFKDHRPAVHRRWIFSFPSFRGRQWLRCREFGRLQPRTDQS